MFFDSKKSEVVLVIDIGNGSVGGALSLLTSGEKPRIIFSMRDLFVFEEKPTAEKLEKAVFQSLGFVISEITKNAFLDSYFKSSSKKIDRILCVLSSPWFIHTAKTIVVSQEKKFIITERFLEDILKKELGVFEQSVSGSSSNNEQKRIVEKKMMSMKINGYNVKNPLGQKVDHLELSFYMSEANERFIKNIEHCISKYTHQDIDTIVFHSFASIIFSTISTLFPSIPEYLHFDVAGEITDISWIKGRIIKKMVSYPTGTNLLIRRISKRLSVPHQVARSYFHLYMDKRAESTLYKEIQEALNEAENEWNVYLSDALASLDSAKQDSVDDTHKNIVTSKILNLPSRVFVTAYPRTFELFDQFLHEEKTDETGDWRKHISITYIGPELLSTYIISNNLQQFDSFLALETLFLSQ